MKKYILITLLVLSSQFAKSQSIKIIEPDFSGTIVFVNDSIGNGLKLETTNISQKSKASASMYLTGIGKITTVASVKGESSTVRIKKSNTLQFVYKAEVNTVNPVEVIQLIRFKTKRGNRVSEIGRVGTFSGASSGDIGFVEFSAQKYGTSSYLVTVSNLSEGEYGFSLGKEKSVTAHMFTIE